MLKLKFKDSTQCIEYLLGSEFADDEIYTNMYTCIKYGVEKGYDEVIFMYVQFDEEEDMYINLNKTDWKYNLNTCLEHFIKIENYEMCSDIKKLMTSMG